MNKEEHFLKNRFLELAGIAYERNIYTYTDFLNINEISILNSFINQLPPVNLILSGGNPYAERKIASFSPIDVYYEEDFPISTLQIAPINPQFADKLTHRDFLGALLNLGITRNKIGDIFIKDNSAFVYCLNDISFYIADNLTGVRHTTVKCKLYENKAPDIAPEFKTVTGTIANIRLDSLISTAFGVSRSSMISYIESGKVFVNGKLITSNGYSVNEGDIVSVRGKGRFIYNGTSATTKKGRNIVSVSLYI